MFNVQEVDDVSHDDRDGQPTVTPKNYQFVFLRFVNQVIRLETLAVNFRSILIMNFTLIRFQNEKTNSKSPYSYRRR